MGPRNVAGAVVRGPDFWGREKDVRRLWALIERGSVLLTGPRRWGKSSLMEALEDQPLPGWQVLGLDVEYVEDPAEFLTELTATLLTTLPVRKVLASISKAPSAIARWIRETVESFDMGTPELGEVKI